jgi:hypothetical protein
MCEKKDCPCGKKETTVSLKEPTVTFNYNELSIQDAQTLRTDLPSSGLVYYLLPINSTNILVVFSYDKTTIREIKFENNLSELELDNLDITLI